MGIMEAPKYSPEEVDVAASQGIGKALVPKKLRIAMVGCG